MSLVHLAIRAGDHGCAENLMALGGEAHHLAADQLQGGVGQYGGKLEENAFDGRGIEKQSVTDMNAVIAGTVARRQ